MSAEKTPENQQAGESVVPNEIPGFFVSWLNSDGEREEGPLSLLWRLIESYKVDIFDVSLYRITQDFTDFVRSTGDLHLELASPFLVMSARLLYYKSKALLPDPGFDEPDTDPRLPPELIHQLLEYRKFQMASEKLREMDEVAAGMFSRKAGFQEVSGAETGEEKWLDVDIVDLIQAYTGVVRRLQEGEEKENGMVLSMEEHSVEDRMAYIRKLLEDSVSFGFSDLFDSIQRMNRLEIVVTFLAILELVKLLEIIVRQERIFGEIRIFKKSSVVH